MVFPLNLILNVSPNLQIAIYLKDYSSLPYSFSMMLKSISFPLYCATSYLNLGERFSFTAAYSLKSEKNWPVNFAKLWTRESDSVYNHVS